MSQNNEIQIAPELQTSSAEEIVDRAMSIFGTYHTTPALERHGDRIVPGNLSLLYYYNNRLNGYPMKSQAVPTVLAAERAGRPDGAQSPTGNSQAVA